MLVSAAGTRGWRVLVTATNAVHNVVQHDAIAFLPIASYSYMLFHLRWVA